MSTEPIRVLHVDDESDFTDLAGAYLERANDRLALETAANPSSALEILAEEDVDCIVSDYDMPGQNGIEFLSTVREEFPDLPFILFTGKGSEEVASRAISAGVSDYLQKKPGTERYELLANRIVSHVERTRAERELKEREQQLQLFRKAVEAAGHSIYWTDHDGTIQYANPAFEETTGYSVEEAIGRNPRLLKSGAHDEEFYDRLWETILSGETWRNEVLNSTKSGEEYVVDQTIAPVTDETGDTTHFVAVNADITDQKQREEQLREERDRREALFQNPSDAIIEIEFDGETPIIQAANDTFQNIFGYDPDAVVGEPVAEVLIPEENEAETRHDEIKYRVLAGETINTHVRRQTREGPREFRLRVFPIDVVDGHRGSYAVYTDITDRVERERDLEEYRTLVETVGDPMYILDAEGYIEMVNDAMLEYLGAGEDTVVGSRISQYMAEGDFERGTAHLLDLLNDPERQWTTFEMTAVTTSGERIPGEINVAALTDDGEFRGSVGVVRDLSERKEFEQELERYEIMVEATGDPVYTLDEEGRFTFLNEAALEITGYSEEALLGKPVQTVVAPENVEPAEELVRSLLAEGEQHATFEIDIQTKTGEVIPAENRLSLLYSDGEFQGSVGVVRDISDRVERERKLQRERDRLDRFAGVVSHDLRNPLNVASGRLELLKEDCESEHLESVEQALGRMDTLIDDVLTLARAGETVGKLETVQLGDLIDACWTNVETESAQLHSETTATIRGDETRLQQLFENLFRNAVEHGGPDVSIRVGDLPDGFYVEDDGPGITDEARDQILEPGYSTSEEGTGFGLSIVRDIAAAHGWDIDITAGEDGGARFEITSVEFAPD